MASRIILAAIALAGSAIAPIHATERTMFRFQEKQGPYVVGLKVVEQYDTSRAFGPASARPVQTLVWYPAASGGSKPMTVGDYVELATSELDFGGTTPRNDAIELHRSWKSRMVVPLDTALWAFRNAPAAKGHFPVVIYAPGSSSVSWDNADLCEYMASHGYVVVASPSLGADSQDMPETVAAIEEQARDISFLIDYAKTLPNTDTGEVAVAGWSWGGLSNVFAAARDKRIRALVALDGSLRYFPALVHEAGDVHPEQMTLPLLAFTQGNLTLEQAEKALSEPNNKGPSVLNAWTKGDLYSVDMLGMSHPAFSSMVQRRKTAEQFAEDQKADYDRDEVSASYGWVAMYTVRFLDAYLKHDVAAATFLKQKPARNGVPAHFMHTEFRAASKPSVP